MSLFNRNKKPELLITDADKQWVEENYLWLMQCFGYPNSNFDQIEFDKKNFPKSHSTQELEVQNLIDDLTLMLGLKDAEIKFEFYKDLRDSVNVPYQIDGNEADTGLDILSDHSFNIKIRHFLQKHPNRLIQSLILEMVKIKLIHHNLPFEGNDSNLFMYVGATYWGFGVLLAQRLRDTGISVENSWETTWNYVSEMPGEVMAYALAVYSSLVDKTNPEWKADLPSGIREQFDLAIEYLKDNPLSIFNNDALKANSLFAKGAEYSEQGDYNQAIEEFRKILFLDVDVIIISDAHNSIGYSYIRMGEYMKSLPSFQKALEIDPEYGYALDNLGMAYIQLGNLEEGKQYLDLAFKTNNNDVAYSYRNLALYHQAKGNDLEAKRNFELAFEHETMPVDSLEYFYAKFLLEHGEKEQAIEYLQKAIDKADKEADLLLKEINK